MKKILLSLLVLTATLSLVACDSQSSNVFKFILDDSFDEFLVMETSADYPPFENIEEVDGKNTVVGIDIEIAKAIALAAGKNLQVVHKGFDFLITDIQNGKADFAIAAITPTPERLEQVDFSDVYLDNEDEQVAVIKSSDATNYVTIDDINLETVRVGAQTGSLQSYILQDQAPESYATYIQDLNTLFENLNNGQIEVLLSEKTVAETYIADEYSDLQIAFSVYSQYNGNAIAVQKDNAALLAIINETIATLKESGQIDTWVEYYSAQS
ncbi:transporter substrate-binding domain-containing protein [Mycoplasmatota bacterium]|nr:transporter substrate-binding domain-containing protein [Mycoplasmatota bacterium]